MEGSVVYLFPCASSQYGIFSRDREEGWWHTDDRRCCAGRRCRELVANSDADLVEELRPPGVDHSDMVVMVGDLALKLNQLFVSIALLALVLLQLPYDGVFLVVLYDT